MVNSLQTLDRAARHSGLVSLDLVVGVVVGVAGGALLVLSVTNLSVSRPEMTAATVLLGLNGALSLGGILIALRRRYPILFMAFYFDYIFFSIAPLQQIHIKWDAVLEDDPLLFIGIIQCLLFSALALGAMYFRSRSRRKSSQSNGFLTRSVVNHFDYHPQLLFVATALAIVFLLGLYGENLFTSRETLSDSLSGFDKSTTLFFTSFLTPFAFVGSVIGLRAAQKTNSWFWAVLFMILFIAALVIVNPVVTPRFRLSALVIFALLVFTGWNNTRILSLAVIFGVAVSPLLNLFRYNVALAENRTLDTFFAHMDYDGLTMMCHVEYYVTQIGYSYGSNILSALLFFVPRSVWPGKSEHITYYMFPYLEVYRDFGTDNLSSPPTAEGYFAFGIVGAIALTIVVFKAFITIEQRANASEQNAPWQLIACMSSGLALILLRGPFLIGYSEFVGHIVATLAAVVLLRPRSLFRRPPLGLGLSALSPPRS